MKRRAGGVDLSSSSGRDGRPSKKAFPIFDKPSRSQNTLIATSSSSGPFQWLDLPSPSSKSCLYGIHLSPDIRPRIAAFDLDGTVIESSFSKGKPKNDKDIEWAFWHKKVPDKLREVHQCGYTIVFITNQFLGEKRLIQWRRKIPTIAQKLSDVPFIILAATDRNIYRKPMPGMWIAVERLAREAGTKIDMSNSYYVGDAAGRKADHAGTDRKFAENVGLSFCTPEEYFLNLPSTAYALQGFHVRTLPSELPRISPSSTPILPVQAAHLEIVLFVGLPATGKTTFFERHFAPAGYMHVNQDTLGNRAKCIKAVEAALKEGRSCVVDNTNRDTKTRKFYIELAVKLNVPVRCFVFQSSIELAWHNNLYRTYCLPSLDDEGPTLNQTADEQISRARPRKLVPYSAFTGFRQDYEEPTITEGFQEIKFVNWTFEGSEKERRMWEMWLQIDGK